MSASLENALEYLKIQERLRTKISQSIIYVKEYFYVFLCHERYHAVLYNRRKVNQIIELAKTLRLFQAFQGNAFCSFEHLESSGRIIRHLEGTRTLNALRNSGTRGTLFSRLLVLKLLGVISPV